LPDAVAIIRRVHVPRQARSPLSRFFAPPIRGNLPIDHVRHVATLSLPERDISAQRDVVSEFCSNPRISFPSNTKSTCRKPCLGVRQTAYRSVPRSTDLASWIRVCCQTSTSASSRVNVVTLLGGLVGLDLLCQNQDDDNHHDQAKPTAWVISPASAVKAKLVERPEGAKLAR
jgi:hypothetical protein